MGRTRDAVVAGLLYLVGGFSRRVVPLASRPGRRLLWASIVTVGGVVGAAFVVAVTDATGEPEPRWVALGLITVPFPSIAALMVGPRPVRAVIGLLLIATVAVAGWLPGATLPHDDGSPRREHAGLSAELALSSELPGFTRRSITFENDALVTELRATADGGADVSSHVTVVATPAQTAAGCEGRTGGPWGLSDVDGCIEDADGSLYQQGGGVSAYIVRRGDVEIHAFSHERASRQLLRDAAHSARPATEVELKEALDPAPGHADREVWRHFLELWGRLIDDRQ